MSPKLPPGGERETPDPRPDTVDQSESRNPSDSPQAPPTDDNLTVLQDKYLTNLTISTTKPSVSPNNVDIETIPKAPKNVVGNHRTMPNRDGNKLRPPNQMARQNSSSSNRSRESSPFRVPYSTYVEQRKPRKVVTWDAAMSARPPLRIDMEGPTPCSYTPVNKPLHETNAPAWSFGRKTFVEKDGGARTSWEKTWFQNADVWTQKADFYSDRRWPAPSTHRQRHTVGTRLATALTSPQHTFGYRRNNNTQLSSEPAPNEYNLHRSQNVTSPRAPSYSHSLRRGGTILWSYTETSPGPGTYKPELSYRRIKTHHPSFSIRGTRRQQVHALGPFAAF